MIFLIISVIIIMIPLTIFYRSLSFKCYKLLAQGHWVCEHKGTIAGGRQVYVFPNKTMTIYSVGTNRWKAEFLDADIAISPMLCSMGIRRGMANMITGKHQKDLAKELL